jgi:hypothetical protein
MQCTVLRSLAEPSDQSEFASFPSGNPVHPVNPVRNFFRQKSFPTIGNFFPIVGKKAKNFSNHWKNRAKFSNHWKIFFQSLENLRRAVEPADCAKPGGVSVFRQDLQDLQDFGRPSSTGRPKTDHAAQELTTLNPPASRQHPENALFPPVSAVGMERA